MCFLLVVLRRGVCREEEEEEEEEEGFLLPLVEGGVIEAASPLPLPTLSVS